MKNVPLWFSGQKVKGQGHNALITKNGLCCIIAFRLHLLSWYFIQRLPMSKGCVLLISGSKGKRSRSQCIDYWKWFMLHNCFPFTPIMKLHTKTPHELRMCPIDLGAKSQRSRSQCIDYWKWLVLHNCFPFTPIIMKLHIKTPHDFRMCLLSWFRVPKVKVIMHWFLNFFCA